MQVTDIHVSKFYTKGGLPHLEAFIYHELPLVAPDLVLCTGDLTDAKSANTLTSMQHKEEWVAYHTLLKESRVLDRQQSRFWWDQRGNHDCWNIPSFKSSENHFRTLSSIKAEGYSFVLHKPYGKYSFVAIDGCPEIGSGRPMNFFGYLDTKDMDFLADSLLDSITQHHNHTFAMSHYPTGTTSYGKTKDGIGFWEMTHHVSVWLSGHLHKLAGGFGETMYAFQDSKVLELELGDMKSHGMFRVIAVDHDMVSFVDLPIHGEQLPLKVTDSISKTEFVRPPIVLVTNPKDGRYAIPEKEPQVTSTHIRALIWGTSELVSVYAIIDGTIVGNGTYHGRGSSWKSVSDIAQDQAYIPLWTIPWDISHFEDDEVHYLTVVAYDQVGQMGNQTVRFRGDMSRIAEMDAGTGGWIIQLPLGALVAFVDVVQRFVHYMVCHDYHWISSDTQILCIDDRYGRSVWPVATRHLAAIGED
jgi:predicted phosphohydrolase